MSHDVAVPRPFPGVGHQPTGHGQPNRQGSPAGETPPPPARCDRCPPASTEGTPAADERTDLAIGQLNEATGPEIGDVLRRQAHLLAYRSALAHARDLNRIEGALVAAVLRHAARSDPVHDYALDVVRTHMVRGLIEAAQRTGTSTVFWRDP